MLGNRQTRILFVLAEVIILGSQWTAPLSRVAIWLDSLGNCAAHLMFGVGLLRELNRERREFVGMASAFSMLFYGVVQLTSIKNELFFDGYILAALLKFALVLTMLSFGTMVSQTIRTRKEGKAVGQLEGKILGRQAERQDLVELLVNLNFSLRHDLSGPLQPLNLLVPHLAAKLPEGGGELTSRIRKALRRAEDFFDHWPQGLSPQPVDLKALLSKRRFIPKSDNDDQAYWVAAPPLFLKWAFDRLRENARAAGARKVTATLTKAVNEHNRPIAVVRIANDGPPIPPDAQLFKKPHGTWIALHLIELVEGKLTLESTGLQPPVFRIELPAANVGPLP